MTSVSARPRSAVFLRYLAASGATALVDNGVFAACGSLGLGIGGSLVCGRLAAMIFNYMALREAVFLSRTPHPTLVARYVGLVAVMGGASYLLIRVLRWLWPVGAVPAKLAAEAVLFVLIFLAQRRWVFSPARSEQEREY